MSKEFSGIFSAINCSNKMQSDVEQVSVSEGWKLLDRDEVDGDDTIGEMRLRRNRNS